MERSHAVDSRGRKCGVLSPLRRHNRAVHQHDMLATTQPWYVSRGRPYCDHYNHTRRDWRPLHRHQIACLYRAYIRQGPETIQNQTIYIKDPAFVPINSDQPETLVIWTLDPHRHNEREEDEDGNVTTIELYLPAVIMHELGHAAGLAELRDYSGYDGTVMHQHFDDFTDDTEPTDILELIYCF